MTERQLNFTIYRTTQPGAVQVVLDKWLEEEYAGQYSLTDGSPEWLEQVSRGVAEGMAKELEALGDPGLIFEIIVDDTDDGGVVYRYAADHGLFTAAYLDGEVIYSEYQLRRLIHEVHAKHDYPHEAGPYHDLRVALEKLIGTVWFTAIIKSQEDEAAK